jgi:glycosyltransferase involved in cell wall biosynthesis
MKLIIQIPCYNEEKTLPVTLRDLPKYIPGIDEIEVLIIDDGSSDNTVDVAKQLGVHHIVSFPQNRGLAHAFKAGMDACLHLGADIIVNTDADNQYNGQDIPKLLQPILAEEAEMVVGDRQTDTIPHFSPIKKKLQKLGSWVVRKASRTDIPDTTSGFRAYTREAAMRINVVSEFTYTLETIIQAGRNKTAIAHVPIRTNGMLRESRLFKGIKNYVKRSAGTIIRIYTMYRPLKFFLSIGFFLLLIGLGINLRFLLFFFQGEGNGHVQSLILGSMVTVVAFQVFMIGIVADLISNNRKMIEETLYRVRKLEIKSLSMEGTPYLQTNSPDKKESKVKMRNVL